jgi:hypothetical protein
MKTKKYIDGIPVEEFTYIQEMLDEQIQEFIRQQQEAKKAGRPGARPSVQTICYIAEQISIRYGISLDRLNY